MKNINDLFNMKPGIYPLLYKGKIQNNEDIIPSLCKEYEIPSSKVVRKDKFSITLSDSSFSYNVKLQVDFGNLISPAHGDILFFRIERLNQQAIYNYCIRSVEELVGVGPGLHALGVMFDELSEEENENSILRNFLASIGKPNSYHNGEAVIPTGKGKLLLRVEPILAAEAFALRVIKLE